MGRRRPEVLRPAPASRVAKAASMSLSLLAFRTRICRPSTRAASLHFSYVGLGLANSSILFLRDGQDNRPPGHRDRAADRAASRRDLGGEYDLTPGRVAARPVETGHKAELKTGSLPMLKTIESKWSPPWLKRLTGSAASRNEHSPTGRRTRSAASAGSRSALPIGPAEFDRYVLALGSNRFLSDRCPESGHDKCANARADPIWRKSDHRHPPACCARTSIGQTAAALLRMPRPTPAVSLDHLVGADEQRGGASRPSAFAVVTLMTSSNLVGSSYRHVGRFVALEYAIDVNRGPPEQVGKSGP